MTERHLRQSVKFHAHEFQPVRIFLADGSTLDVVHPESVVIAAERSAFLVNGSIKQVSNSYIKSVEPLAIS